MSSTNEGCGICYVSFTQSQHRKKRENGPKTKKNTIANVIVHVKCPALYGRWICATPCFSFRVGDIHTSADIAVGVNWPILQTIEIPYKSPSFAVDTVR